MHSRISLLFAILLTAALLVSPCAYGGTDLPASRTPAAANAKPIFGPFEAIALDPAYILGVKVDDAGKIWIKLHPSVTERELTLKISNQKDASYRNWFTGSPVLVSAAGQGKEPNAWTDWIETSSNYIEYWMDGKRILHLKRILR